jgi:hypothetical protein
MAKEVKCWLLTAKHLIQFLVTVYKVCGRQSDIGTGFPFEFLQCQLQIIILLMLLTDVFISQCVV